MRLTPHSAVQLRSGWNQSRPRSSRPNAAAAAGAAAAGRQLPTPEPQPSPQQRNQKPGASRSDPRARRSAPPRPSRARGVSRQAIEPLTPHSAVQLRSGWNQSRPRSSRPNAAAAAGAAAAGRQLPTPEPQPSPQQRNQKRKRRRQPQRSQSAAVCAAPALARARGALRLTPQNAVVQQLGPARERHIVPSSCDRGGIKADPVARDPTRPQQPAPPQRGGSCQRPNPSPHPSSEIKKKTPAPAAAIPERGGLRRPGPRAREGAPLRLTPPKTRVVPASWVPSRRRHLVPSSCDRGGIKADPVARDPTRPQQPAPPQRGGSCQRPNPSPHPSSEIKKEPGASRSDPRARRSAPPRPSRARGCAIEVNAAQNACRASQLGRAQEAPSAVQLRSGWNQSRPRSSRPNAAAAAGAAAAGRQLPTPEPQPSPQQRNQKRNAGASRSDPRARRSAPPRPSRARACAIEVNAAKTRVVPASWGPVAQRGT